MGLCAWNWGNWPQSEFPFLRVGWEGLLWKVETWEATEMGSIRQGNTCHRVTEVLKWPPNPWFSGDADSSKTVINTTRPLSSCPHPLSFYAPKAYWRNIKKEEEKMLCNKRVPVKEWLLFCLWQVSTKASTQHLSLLACGRQGKEHSISTQISSPPGSKNSFSSAV